MGKLIKVLAILGVILVVGSLIFLVVGIPVLNLLIIKIELDLGILIGIALMHIALILKDKVI